LALAANASLVALSLYISMTDDIESLLLTLTRCYRNFLLE
jgi:hypothetical protein